MRVVSKQFDYYDSVQAYGQDQSNVYVRKEKEIELLYKDAIRLKLKDLLNDAYTKYGCENGDTLHTQYYVGFCGKVYPAFFLEYNYTPSTYANIVSKTCWAYSSDAIKAFLLKYKLKQNIIDFEMNTASKWSWRNYFARDSIDRFLTKTLETDYSYLFHEWNVPIFVLKGHRQIGQYLPNNVEEVCFGTVILNPCLKDFAFYKVFDAYQAFQEIAFYMEGVLGMETPDMATVPDKYMHTQKGFDEWSFKTLPTKRKKK